MTHRPGYDKQVEKHVEEMRHRGMGADEEEGYLAAIRDVLYERDEPTSPSGEVEYLDEWREGYALGVQAVNRYALNRLREEMDEACG